MSAPNKSASLFEKMTSIRGRTCPTQKDWAFEAFTNWSNNRNHEDSLGLNEPGPSKAFTGPETLAGPPQTLPPLKAPDVACYTQKNMDHFLQIIPQALKGRFKDKLKAKTLDVYHDRSHIECSNFC